MIKARNKKISLLLVLMMLATMFIGVGTASASTNNTIVGAVPAIASSSDTVIQTLASINIDEGVIGNLATGNVISVTIPTGMKWAWSGSSSSSTKHGLTTTNWTITWNSDQTANLKVDAINYNSGTDTAQVQIPFKVYVTSVGTGAINAVIAAPGTAVSEGSYTIGTFVSGGVAVSALSTPTIGSSGQLGTLRIIENSALGWADSDNLTFKLPSGFTWDGTTGNITGTNGRLVTATFVAGSQTVTLKPVADASQPSTADLTKIGIYDLTTKVTIDSSTAVKGDITVSMNGSVNSTGGDIVIGKYGNYDATLTVASVKSITAGKFYQKTDEITLQENIAGALIQNRDVTFTVPDWVQITDIQPTSGGITYDKPSLSSNSTTSSFSITIKSVTPTTTNGDGRQMKFKLYLSVQANKSGDIPLTVTGSGITDQSATIATAVLPADIAVAASTDITLGTYAQKVGDITISEINKNTIQKTIQRDYTGDTATNGLIYVTLTEGCQFDRKPTIKVTAGNLDIDTDNSYLTNSLGGTTNDRLVIPVKSESTTPATIALSDVYLTTDRTLPQGPIFVKIGGTGVAENYYGNSYVWDSTNSKATTTVASAGTIGTFAVGTAKQVQIANVVTDLNGTTSNKAVFTIGASTFTLNGASMTAFAASYIKDGRTYLAIRDIGSALGIDQNNILWDGSKNTVTLIKGDKVVQLTIGSKVILINGAAVTMDVAPEIGPGDRTMLPAAFVAQAFGETATWDATAQTVTIN